MMTREELTNRIKNIKDKIFDLNLKDRWEYKDRVRSDELHRELYRLLDELRMMGA